MYSFLSGNIKYCVVDWTLTLFPPGVDTFKLNTPLLINTNINIQNKQKGIEQFLLCFLPLMGSF